MSEDLFDKHRATLDRAVEACRTRHSWSAYSDAPGAHPGGEDARRAGEEAFRAQLGRPFEMDHPGPLVRQADEVSPYTGEPLGISYPAAPADTLFGAAKRAWPAWRDAAPTTRVGVCLEICSRIYEQAFELAFATMHTAGQSFGMSYTGSGTNALDRGIEAVAQAYSAMDRVPGEARWSRDFGTSTVTLAKRYRLAPRGIAVVIACASFPAWNVYPALLASLATGNPVILKPHPTSVLQMAHAVRICRRVLGEAGFSPGLVGLAVDSVAEPVAKQLVEHPETRIVDFTGSAAFGSWVEANAFPAVAYTETSGVNSVLIDSMDDPGPVLRALAGSLCLFSAQMCTSPQNIYVPRDGIPTAAGRMKPDEFAGALAEAIRAVSTVPRRAASVMATVQSAQTLRLLDQVRDLTAARGQVILEPEPYAHPEFPVARTSGPLLGMIDVADHDLFGEERFGPAAFVITADGSDQALERAAGDAAEHGAITAFAYSTSEDFLDRAESAYAVAGAALTSNVTGPMPLNFSAAYSDYHVTGLNPAGNASLTDESFIAGRFRVTQSRRPA
ncbi:phenylacetic acid degradation protein PaaN [Planotetraspora sp. A-T 1434]|uniref:phenylacetic acid degradation protein PaaN n=1 Tax=Planotetraspora sp. A-T 1434 TaxID=2979219 RepID=UPI0021BF44ED|nr:phenylacetic acid degradation protein PaaN [Planotetraspora sp. A-T 1434]MCT9930740.1 phenylacetic acid degradation protein PaaN [Planotetraspora sp. A-T 1434]